MAKKNKAAQAQPSIEERKKLAKKELQRELMEALPNSALAEQKRVQRKKGFRNLIYIGIFMFMVYIMMWLFKPYQSGMPYGICKVFIELQTPYPQTIYYSQVEKFRDSVRVWYTAIDPFGEYRLQEVRCYFQPPTVPSRPYELKNVTVNRREINPRIIMRFNTSINTIVSNPPDLTYPTELPDSLEGLQFNFEAFRKQIL